MIVQMRHQFRQNQVLEIGLDIKDQHLEHLVADVARGCPRLVGVELLEDDGCGCLDVAEGDGGDQSGENLLG